MPTLGNLNGAKGQTGPAAILGRAELFQGLNPKQLEELAGAGVRKKYEKGQVIFFEGTKATGFHVVLSGVVKVYKTALDGREHVLHIFGPGEPFGEIVAFEEHGAYPAHSMAVEDSETLYIERRTLLSLMERDQTLALNMIAALSRRLKDFARQIESVALREAPARLAAYLLNASELKGEQSFDLDVSKGLLASMLGTTRETVSRTLTRMVDAGLISRDGRRIAVLNADELSRIAEGEVKFR